MSDWSSLDAVLDMSLEMGVAMNGDSAPNSSGLINRGFLSNEGSTALTVSTH